MIALLAMVLSATGTTSVAYTGKVNLNTATVEQLELLPGVGRKAAGLIVAYRQKRRFARIQELVRVKGFGRKKFLRLEPHLSVEGETDLRVQRRGRDGRVTLQTARPTLTAAAR